MMTINPRPEEAAPPRAKPAYHHPMPWQVATALVMIAAAAVSSLAEAALIGLGSIVADPRFERLLLALLVASVLHATVCTALGACVAARLDWARRLAAVASLYGVACSLMALVIFGVLDALSPAPFAAGGFSLLLLGLLSGEAATRYTYRGGGGSLPDE
ncbi:hypothetical protein ACFQS3_02915 [Glycomyces mayteni]|uniref:TIGR04086 family membrane protein n=1 Tax=Glycomyces mayteni TaxID=543887 RepID=A0ABW2D1G4_9ACTN|nr:hypothetical protein GCM10025732_48960 [Glycomyces mayteni]